MQNIFFTIILVAISCTAGISQWGPNGDNITSSNWLGSINNQPLNFRTNNTPRFNIAKSENITVQGQTFNHAGFVGISTESSFFNTGPYSLLHLNGGNNGGPYSNGFRSWMKYGMTVTSNRDLMYVGIKNNLGLDRTEAVISWSDNNGSTPAYGPDNLVIKFTTSNGNGSTAASSVDGLEVARFAPSGNVGIGDFSNGGYGLDQQPTQKLDIDGQVRIRVVNEENNPDVLITGTEQIAPGDYVLKRKEFSGDPDDFLNGDGDWVNIPGGGDDCDWEADNYGIFTGAPNSSCNTGNVGIGSNSETNAQLFIYDTNTESAVNPGALKIRAYYQEDTPISYGQATTIGGGTENSDTRYGDLVLSSQAISNYGTFSISQGIKNSLGVLGLGANGDNQNIGVYGSSSRAGCNTSISIGVYGEAVENANCPNNNFDYSGYFVGDITTTGGSISVSDMKLKDDIKSIDNATEIINQLQPKSYTYKREKYKMMNLEKGTRYGLIAQELEQVLPNLVVDAKFPTRFDEEGKVSTKSFEYKGVKYMELIPILIQSSKEQQAKIVEQQTTISMLLENMEHIQSKIDDMAKTMSTNKDILGKSRTENISSVLEPTVDFELYQNNPNPFDDFTNISWHMGEKGQAQLVVQDASGKLVKTLVDELSSKGNHTIRWDTSYLNPGIYFYSLLVNDQLIVKRALKINE